MLPLGKGSWSGEEEKREHLWVGDEAFSSTGKVPPGAEFVQFYLYKSTRTLPMHTYYPMPRDMEGKGVAAFFQIKQKSK